MTPRESHPRSRRERQITEIAALVAAGNGERAAGLALEHIAEFPDDADLLPRSRGDDNAATGAAGGPGPA